MGTPIFPKKGKTNFPHFSRIFPRSKQVSSACFSFLCFGNFLRNHNFPCTKKKRLFKNFGSIERIRICKRCFKYPIFNSSSRKRNQSVIFDLKLNIENPLKAVQFPVFFSRSSVERSSKIKPFQAILAKIIRYIRLNIEYRKSKIPP